MLLRCKHGFSLLEIIATLTIAGLIVSVVMSNVQIRIKRANIQKTVTEMIAFSDAAVNYKETTGMCPADIGVLSPTYIRVVSVNNVFGQAYLLTCPNGGVTISSKVPLGSAKDFSLGPLLEVVSVGVYDNITITKRFPVGAAGRLLYDKKNLYGG